MTTNHASPLRRVAGLLAIVAAAAVFPYAGAQGPELPTAHADDKAVQATAELMVLHATQEPGAGSIDPRIGDLPQLKKPPFSAYNTYKLLDKKPLPLKAGAAVTYPMQNGRLLELTLVGQTPDKRYKLVAHIINGKDGKDFLKSEITAAANERFFVAGQSYQGGILVLAISVKP